ncbi:MAG: RagB/SusD family nutrient uptake outer membrane protein [Paludibacteraceae bacterium]|nr:RagB/SusD family nutrient uptake outer membrane protein [Paludibacteraceae bacterium]MBN2787086.1 RagB/SusD family nutrient uptake outer membrane protein [Paludibacteraceae bacterium]
MKKRLFFISILSALVLFTSSCTDEFLKEEVKTGDNEGSYLTEKGLTGLVTACYSYTRTWYGKEPGIGLTEGGTDLWLMGRDNRQQGLVQYSDISPAKASQPEKENPCFDEYWEIFFTAINACNTALYYIDENEEISDDTRKQFKGEVSFLRAFYYWHLVETWGPVPIFKTPTSSATSEVVRDNEAAVYDFMLEDVNTAISSLDVPTITKTGRVNYWAAKAFKARLLLYLASEYNGGNYGGQAKAYTDAAATAQEVIDGSGASFYTNYADCWNQANEDGIKNKETIWYIEYAKDLTTDGLPMRLQKDDEGEHLNWTQMVNRTKSKDSGGNVAHLMFTGMWSNHAKLSKGTDGSLGLQTKVLDRTDNENKKKFEYINPSYSYNVGSFFQRYSKGFCRFAPSGYLLDLYNENTDQRYQASFRDTYKIPAVLTQFKNQSWFTQPDAKNSDTIIYLSKHATLSAQEVADLAGKRYIMGTRTSADGTTAGTFQFPMYSNADGSQLTKTTGNSGDAIFNGNNLFISCSKFDDWGTTNDGTAPLIRDISPRDVFVFRLSEMYLIKAEAELATSPTTALATINYLRTQRAISGQDNTLAGPATIQTILDERAIELCGEQMRWFDLKRLGKLNATYLTDKNLDAANNIKSHHRLRPIPQVQIDATTNIGAVGEAGKFWQNPGY